MTRAAALLILAACSPDPLRYAGNSEPPLVREGGPPPVAECAPISTVLPVIEDTFLFEQLPLDPQGARPDVFYGNQPGARCYPLVRFDGIPEGELLAARLLFTTINVGVDLSAHLLGGVAVWDEGATWRQMEAAALPWLDDAEPVALTTREGRTEVPLPLAWVEDWRSGAHANNGIMLRTTAAMGFNSFSSSEGIDPPTVEIEHMRCAAAGG